MKKKKQIYCQCGMPANWYKKGKNHRVLVCNSCGIIANNPIPLLAIGASMLAKPALKAGLKMLGRTAAEKAGESLASGIAGKGAASTSQREYHVYDSADRPNRAERIVNQELYGR